MNQVARSNKRELDALLKAGERLREAQQKAMGGGGRDELRSAIAEERDQVGKVAALAKPLLGARPEAKLERVRAALHAAATEEATREAIAAGRLVEDAEAVGLGPFGLSEGAATAPAPRRSKKDKAAKPKPGAAKERRAAAKEEPAAAKEDTSRRADAAAARKALRALEAARKQEKSARERAERARSELKRARAHAEEVAKALQGAERRVKEAEAREADAGERLAAAERAASKHA